MLRATGWVVSALALVLFGFVPDRCDAGITTDPAGDFLLSYTGPHRDDLDVIGVEAWYDGTNFTITGYMAGNIDKTFAGRYVWGVNRGAGTAGFASIGIDQVLFDRVIVLNSNGTGSVAGTPVATTVSGNRISAVIPASLVPNNGFGFAQYTWNLWPRSPGAGNGVISDFAPDNSNIGTQIVPEPSTFAAAALAAGAGLVAVRRGRKKS